VSPAQTTRPENPNPNARARTPWARRSVLATLIATCGCNLILGNPSPGGGQSGGAAGDHAGAPGSGATEGDGGEGGTLASGGSTPGTGGGTPASGGGGTTEPDCTPPSERPCSLVDPNLLGNCASGVVTCTDQETWSACSVIAANSDDCAIEGDDANCDGTANGDCPCEGDETQPCGPNSEDGICEFGVSTCEDGSWGSCLGATMPAPRDCTSPDDNDCDGEPDDTIDGTCECAIGTSGDCEEHPSYDGFGICRPGTQPCLAGPDNTSSSYGECTGSVGPEPSESCTADGLDENCNDEVNEGCSCVNGQDADCGNCMGGTQVCVGGQYGPCEGQPDPPVTYYRDQDGDTFGNPNSPTMTCTGVPPGYVTNNTDCCDTDANAKPGQTGYFSTPRNGCGGYDYNCDNNSTVQTNAITASGVCPQGVNGYGSWCNTTGGWATSVPACNGTGTYTSCTTISVPCGEIGCTECEELVFNNHPQTCR